MFLQYIHGTSVVIVEIQGYLGTKCYMKNFAEKQYEEEKPHESRHTNIVSYNSKSHQIII